MRLRQGQVVRQVVRKGAGAFEVDGTVVRASARPIDAHRFEGRLEETLVPVFLAREGDRVFTQIAGRSYAFTVVARSTPEAEGSLGAGALEAPMPGRVSRVEVSVGDAVTRGQELVVVEAMKMENAVVAPWNGVVKSLNATVGDMVAPGAPLVVVEARS